MITFTATIQQFGEKGEKTGWMYITIPADIAQELKPGNKKTFRVKGKLDQHPISAVALMPMGDGSFIMAINASMRKGTGKKKGAMLKVQLAPDTKPIAIPPGFMEALNDEPEAKAFFDTLKLSQRNYFINWVGAVKTDAAIAKKISIVVSALLRKQDFVTMVRSQKAKPSDY